MRFAAPLVFGPAGEIATLGVLVGDEIAVPERVTTLLELLRAGDGALDAYARAAHRGAGHRIAVEDARLASPLPNPPTVRDYMTFESHVIGGMGRGDRNSVAPAWWEIPTFYFTNPYAIHGPQDDIPLAPGTDRFDYELEVAAVIGREGFNVPLEEARQHIAGYSLFIDWSARDIQMHEMTIGLGPAKGKDTASTLGPWFVTADEFDDLTVEGRVELDLSVTVNGQLTGRGNLREMGWSFDSLVAYAARGTWIRPGDVLGSGTCNDGCLAERWGREGFDSAAPLRAGDVVEVDAGLLGTVTQRIVASVPRHPVPHARQTESKGADHV